MKRRDRPRRLWPRWLLASLLTVLAIAAITLGAVEYSYRGPAVILSPDAAEDFITDLAILTTESDIKFEFESASLAYMKQDYMFGEVLACRFNGVDTSALRLPIGGGASYAWAVPIGDPSNLNVFDALVHWPVTPQWLTRGAKATHTDQDFYSWNPDVESVWFVDHRDQSVTVISRHDWGNVFYSNIMDRFSSLRYRHHFRDLIPGVGSEARRWARLRIQVER